MPGGDQNIADRIMVERVEEYNRLAADRRTAHQVRRSSEERMTARRLWLSRQARHMLRWMGRKLSALDERMIERSLHGSLPPGQAVRGRS